MGITKVFETTQGTTPSIVIYRNKPDQFFIQFQEDGMSMNNFTVDERLVYNNDMHRVHDFERNINKVPTKEQQEAFQIARDWLMGKK